jgi:polyphenol oxidase
MLERRVASNGVTFYASPLLEGMGVPHAFSTRLGGISHAPFDSLNLGNPNGSAVQDDYENVWENYRRLQAAAGCAGRELCHVHQVHGSEVVRAVAGRAFDMSAKADALVGSDLARVLSVRVADCVPILLAAEGGRTVAAVHAGWRGVISGAVPAALAAMGDETVAGTCVAAIGPCIGGDAFEVGPEVVADFARVFGDDAPIVRRVGEKGHVDLREAVRLQLLRAGVPENRINTTDRCTHRDADEFFSHRRENGLTGRLAALISPAR